MLYQPPHFSVGDRDIALELMRRHPLATLVSVAEGDEPVVSHAPLVARVDGERLVLLGHLAKPNPQWKQWRDGDRVLAIFRGPDAYVSPFFYVTKEAVPTWNYAVVHAAGGITIWHESEAKERVLKALIDAHDVPYRARWDELDIDWREKMKGGIVAFEVAVTRLDVKFKVSQNRNEADRAGVLQAMRNGDARARELAEWMQRVMPPA
ncbi:MAG: FMN-binding negative transcriptional regulator [Burkholderiaceae bacterium]